ncbi:unnamed protein product [Ixodes persulcatus]
MAAPVWVAFLAVLVVWYFFWRRRKLSVFKTIGIPGPAPSFFTGNMSEILKKGSVVTFTEWIKQYGDLVGFFNGGTPVLIVKNVDLLKKIQIKDFGNFTCRGVVSAVSKNHNLSRRALTNVPGERWKEVRSLLKPAFKASNMKQVKPFHTKNKLLKFTYTGQTQYADRHRAARSFWLGCLISRVLSFITLKVLIFIF